MSDKAARRPRSSVAPLAFRVGPRRSAGAPSATNRVALN